MYRFMIIHEGINQLHKQLSPVDNIQLIIHYRMIKWKQRIKGGTVNKLFVEGVSM